MVTLMEFLAMYTYQEMLTGSIFRTGLKVLFSEKKSLGQ